MQQVARQAYEAFTGSAMFDVCVEHPDHPWAGARLDVITQDGEVLAELKGTRS